MLRVGSRSSEATVEGCLCAAAVWSHGREARKSRETIEFESYVLRMHSASERKKREHPGLVLVFWWTPISLSSLDF